MEELKTTALKKPTYLLRPNKNNNTYMNFTTNQPKKFISLTNIHKIAQKQHDLKTIKSQLTESTSIQFPLTNNTGDKGDKGLIFNKHGNEKEKEIPPQTIINNNNNNFFNIYDKPNTNFILDLDQKTQRGTIEQKFYPYPKKENIISPPINENSNDNLNHNINSAMKFTSKPNTFKSLDNLHKETKNQYNFKKKQNKMYPRQTNNLITDSSSTSLKLETNHITGNAILNNFENINTRNIHQFSTTITQQNSLFEISEKIKPTTNFVLDLDQEMQRGEEENNDDLKPYSKQQISEWIDYLKLNLNTIINTYQPTFINGSSTGFGDFIRGNFFLMQFCDQLNIAYGVVINHPISSLLQQFKDIPLLPTHISNSIEQNKTTNFNADIETHNIINLKPYSDMRFYDDFIYYLKHTTIYNRNCFINTIAMPNNVISQKHKDAMKNILEPNEALTQYIDETLTQLTLYKNKYDIIHVRFGDQYLIHHQTLINVKQFKTIVDYLNDYDVNKKYILLSDNEDIKKALAQRFPFIQILTNKIGHIGVNFSDVQQLRDTMLEFYLISHAANITAYSTYAHGSGFSKWCAETYSIPYVCKYLPV
jgi:hypothetical protein